MLKHLHKILLIQAIFCLCLATPIAIAAPNIPNNTATMEQMELIHKDIKVNDLDIEPINTSAVKKNVVPDTKQEGKKLIGLFLKSMIMVAFCAVILYIILVFVKKYYGSAFVSNEYEEIESLDLTTPNNKQDALKSFLNRTK